VRLDALDTMLEGLIARHDVAVTFYVNATGATTWQTFATAVGICHCRLRSAAHPGFDAVLLGNP
jgi:hypothetical protein